MTNSSRILVAGDCFIDEWVAVTCRAPDPAFECGAFVVDPTASYQTLGGAGNVACNLSRLNESVVLVGAGSVMNVVSHDWQRYMLLGAYGAPARRRRYAVRGASPFLRIDTPGATKPAIYRDRMLEKTKAVVLVDYGQGLLRPQFINDIVTRFDGPIFYSTKTPPDATLPLQDVVMVINGNDSDKWAYGAVDQLASRCRVLLTTRTESVTWRVGGQPPRAHLVDVKPNMTPCGAGDAFLSALVHLWPRGTAPDTAIITAAAYTRAALTNHGVTRLTTRSILDARAGDMPTTRMYEPVDAAAAVTYMRSEGETVAFVNGTFDPPHAGHAALIAEAAQAASVVVVAVNTDASVRRLKGDGRPCMPYTRRAEIIAKLPGVTMVVPLADDHPGELIQRLSPHLVVKGPEYATGGLPEAPAIMAVGAKLVTSTQRIMSGTELRAAIG